MSSTNRRSALLIYKPIQILILKVIVASCLLSIFSIFSASGFFYYYLLTQYADNQDIEMLQSIKLLNQYGGVYLIFVAVGLIFAISVIIYSWLKLSHKIAGPLYKMRKNLTEYAENEVQEFTEIKLREGDELQDLGASINAAILKALKSN